MSAISFQNVSKFFKGTCAVSDLTMEIPEGRVTAFLGPNGAGKTTTIRMMLGLEDPGEGKITVRGTNSRVLKAKDFEEIGYVSENLKLPLWMNVRQYLDFCRPLYPGWDCEFEKKLAEQFQLPPKQKLKSLSRGQLMKVTLLSNLAFRPKLVVLDEPFSGLDPLVRDELVGGLLEQSENQEWSVFISSHDVDEIERLADHVAILKGGILQSNESVDSLLARFRKVFVSIRQDASLSGKLPSEWFGFERSGRFLTFVHERWNEEAAAKVRSELGGVIDGEVTGEPMSLRSVLVALLKKTL